MKEIVHKLRKRWVWGIGVFLLLTVGLVGFMNYRRHQQVQAADGFQISNSSGATIDPGGVILINRPSEAFFVNSPAGVHVTKYEWVSTNKNIIQIIDPLYPGTGSNMVTFQVQNTADSVQIKLSLEYTDADGKFQTKDVNFLVKVEFKICEYLGPTADSHGSRMQKIFSGDPANALVMEHGAVLDIGNNDPIYDDNYLKLIFGDGRDAVWESENEDVIKYDSANKKIQAVGVGKTKLKVKYNNGVKILEDDIEVYVKPQIESINGEVLVGGVGNDTGIVEVENNDKIKVNVKRDNKPQDGMGDKVVWVISKGELGTEQLTLVRDSLGNTGPDADEARLVPNQEDNSYRIVAKAGIYNIQFYTKGTYKSFEDTKEDADPEKKSLVTAINLITRVRCSFSDKTVSLSLGSTYNIADAFNLPLKILENNFSYEIVSGSAIVGVEWKNSSVVSTKMLGTSIIKIRKNSALDSNQIPGLGQQDEVLLTINVEETFSLNRSAAEIAVGSNLDLWGLIGSNANAENSQFVWSVSDPQYVSLNNDIGRYVQLTALKETPLNHPVRVTLKYTDTRSITWVANCDITITSSATDFRITPSTLRLEAGSSEYLNTNLTGTQNILWVSSDTSIATVEAQTGSIAARVTATQKSGQAVITAINRDNDVYATCLVTVTSAITDITIAQGESLTTSIATPFVFLDAVYEPKDATSTELIWTSSDESVATVDEKGMLTILKVGPTTITVKPAYNPFGVFKQCVVTVKDDPITGIKTNVSSLEMVKGEKYEVGLTLTPVNPSDRTLTWSSTKSNVATVNNGVITATGVGTTTVMVQGGSATALIDVTVREKLTSIQFKDNEMTVGEGEKKALEVIYTPSENVRKDLTFRSTDTSIATVDAKGVVTGVKEGMAMIIATAAELGTNGAITCMIHVTKPKVPVEEFSIDPEEMSLFVGEEQQITPIYIPDDTSRQEVTYTAGNEAVATVSEEGLVTAVAPGFTIITCQDVASGKTAICQVSVETGIKFTLSPASREIAIGKSFNLKKVTVPSNAKKTATWKSSNKAIATVNSSGKVTGKKLGSCTITCTLTYYGQSATCRVKVAKLKSSVKLDKTSIRMNIGSTYRLKKTVKSNDSKLPSVKFTSKNSSIASVGANSGKIKAKRVGSTYIVAKTTDATHATARCRVIVIRRASGVSLNKAYAVCYIGRTLKLKAKVSPSNATIKKVKWSSSDKKVAVVNGSGKITGYAEGETYITATTTDGGNKKARCLVKVMEPIETSSIMVAQTNLTMKRGDTAKLSYTILPDDHTDTIKMASDNTRVATVTNSGKVKAVGTGTATITIMAESGVTATVTVNVVALNKTSIRMRQYDTETLVVHGTSDPITWYSANTSIATVVNGRVVGRSVGTTYVYAYVNGCRMSCRIEVVSIN